MKDNAGRVVHEAEIDKALAKWCLNNKAKTIIDTLEAERVPVGPIYNVESYKIPIYTVNITRERLIIRAKMSGTNLTLVEAKWVYTPKIVNTRYVEKTFVTWSNASAKYRMDMPIPTGKIK
jgi:hypothetical protein